MKFHRIHPHPRFAELRDALRAHPDWFRPWIGTFFRFQTLDFPMPRQVLSGQGAGERGGRWNPPGLATLYGSLTDATALEECNATGRYYGLDTKGPRLVVAIEARLNRVLDLTSPATRRSLGLTAAELIAEDWRKMLEARQESFGQTLGRAVAASGGSGLLARSASVRGGVNVAVFPGACADDHLGIVEGDKLAKLGVRSRA